MKAKSVQTSIGNVSQTEDRQPTYNDIYLPILRGGYDVGFKLILGPTGNGKTSALYQNHNGGNEFVFNILPQLGKHGRKAIFTTHRKNIVKDVVNGCKEAGVKYVHLRAHADIIKGIINNGVQSLINELSDLGVFSYTARWVGGGYKQVDDKYIKKQFRIIADLVSIAKSGRDEKEIRDECGQLLSIFRKAIKDMSTKSQERHKRILKSKSVQELFPFIAFKHDPTQVVLLATLQRLGGRFFDGKNDLSLYDLKGYVIFMDEFDYLPTAMLDNIIEGRKNIRPVNFVSLFCEHFAGKNNDHEVMQKAIDIAGEFESDMMKLGFSFPRGNTEKYKFSNADGLFKRADGSNFGYIFDGGYTVSSGVFYLRDKIESDGEKSFVFTDNDSDASFLSFYEMVKSFENKIFNFFNNLRNKELKEKKKSGEDATFYDTLVREVYNENNDVSTTEYQKFIEYNHPANRLAKVSIRKLLDIVKHDYIHNAKKSKESVISELLLPESQVEFDKDYVELSPDLKNSLLINESTAKRAAKWILPNPNDLPQDWETYVFAYRSEIRLHFATGISGIINKRLSSYVLKKGTVIKLRKSLTSESDFQALSIYPNIRQLDCDDRFYSEGYNYNQIRDGSNFHNPHLVYINNYNMPITPEGRLFALTARNLVFGLTATGDIERHFGSFALRWHSHALKIFQKAQEESADGLKVYIDQGFQADDKIIAAMLEQKNALRKTKLLGSVRDAEPLNGKDEWSKKLLKGLDYLGANGVYLYGDEDVKEGVKKRRLNRVSRHFEILRWILEDSQRETHLVFTDTFSLTLKIFKWFSQVNIIQSDEAQTIDNDDLPHGFFEFPQFMKFRCAEKIISAIEIERVVQSSEEGKGIPTVFTFTLNRDLNQQKCCYVIFANARTWDNIYDNNKQFYNQIFDKGAQENRRVVVMTQHASASNGVNLQFAIKTGNNKPVEKDFESIHILDPQYYYFSDGRKDDDTDDEDEHRDDSAVKEKAIYLASKLKINGVITTAQLKDFIGRFHFGDMNRLYKKTNDYRCDLFALFSQEIGRVERTRRKARSTEVTINPEIRDVIELLLDDEINGMVIGEVIYRQRQNRISTLLNEILKDLDKSANKTRRYNNRRREPLNGIRTRYEKEMEVIINNKLPALRAGKLSEENAKKVRKLWADIRTAALKGEYEAQLDGFDFRYLCRVETKYITYDENDREVVYIKDDSIIPNPEPNCQRYYLNSVYEVVQENRVLNKYFNNKGFQLSNSYTKHGYNNIFIPEFQQAIVKGAIGEEGLKALLQHAGIEIEDDDAIPNQLFELFDFKVKGLPIYIDAKNWEPAIIKNFATEPSDADVHDKLHHYPYVEKGLSTLQAIKSLPGNKNAKIIYINLMYEGENYYTERAYYFDEQYQRVFDYQKASFVYLAGALDYSNKKKVHRIFDELLSDMEKYLMESNNA
jgi:hypothetical protein